MSLSTMASALVHRVASISDAQARVAYLRTVVPGFAPDEFADAHREIVRLAGMRDSAAQVTLLALSAALESLRENAKKSVPPARRAKPIDDTVVDEADEGFETSRTSPRAKSTAAAAARRNDWGTGRPLTLGERKSLARRPERRLLERALRDAHPDVIAELLLNPRLTESDVARMCAAPDVRPEVIARVFAAPRWAVRHHVRRAIANNPRTPVDIALALVPLLASNDLREVSGDMRLAPAVRYLATDVLARLTPRKTDLDVH